MWINKRLLEIILQDNRRQQEEIARLRGCVAGADQHRTDLTAQKAKDDLHLDYCRHRINALERERAILLNKAAGIVIAVPEIVEARPGTMSPPFDFGTLPSFEDVGDSEAMRLGIEHDDSGTVVYGK